jgi:hypothetical protein
MSPKMMKIGRLVALMTAHTCRQIESNQSESGFAVGLILEPENVLMPFRARFELKVMVAVNVFVVDAHVPMPAAIVRAGQAF